MAAEDCAVAAEDCDMKAGCMLGRSNCAMPQRMWKTSRLGPTTATDMLCMGRASVENLATAQPHPPEA
eukprot:3100243-Pleurochrysis_carterae.AAC.1